MSCVEPHGVERTATASAGGDAVRGLMDFPIVLRSQRQDGVLEPALWMVAPSRRYLAKDVDTDVCIERP